MKIIYGSILSFCIVCLFSLSAIAQKGTLQLDLNYNYSIPTSNFKSDLIHTNSPRGGNGGLTYYITNQLGAGISIGYQDYYQKYDRKLYSITKTSDMSAVLTNSIQTTPVIIKAKYSLLKNNSSIKPYVTLGAGANLIDFKQYLGQFATGNTSIGFAGEVGLGIMIPFSKTQQSGIDIGGNYSLAPFNKYGYKDLNTFNLKAGIFLKLQ